MRYIKLYEDFNTLKLPDNFKRDCAPFIEKLKECNNLPKGKYLFYRGVKDAVISKKELYNNIAPEGQSPIYKAKMNPNRIPLDTPMHVHKEFNDYFNSRFGWNVRDGIFCYREAYRTSHYGDAHIFVPIGKFDFCWSKTTKDFYADFEDLFKVDLGSYDDYLTFMEMEWEYEQDGLDDEEKIDFNDWLYGNAMSERTFRADKEKRIIDIVDTYTDDSLCSPPDHEVSFNCEEYYLFSMDYDSLIYEAIWG